MKIFLAGADSFIGRQVVKVLLDEGHSFRCVLPHLPKNRLLEHENVELLVGDTLNPSAINMSGCDAVISFEASPSDVVASVDKRTENLIRAAKMNEVQHFLLLSTLRSSQHNFHMPKARAEEKLISSGLPYTIFRSSLIYGHGDELIDKYRYILKKNRTLPVIDHGSAIVQPIYVGDVADAMTKVLDKKKHKGRVYELAGKNQYRSADLLKMIAQCNGSKVRLVNVPIDLSPFLDIFGPLRYDDALLLAFSTHRSEAGSSPELKLKLRDFRTILRSMNLPRYS